MVRSKPEALLSPRQVAEALGVSESSVKRWSDDGLIATQKTAGGHRKLALADVLGFVREQGYAIGKPELLGLARLPRHPLIDDSARDQLWTALLAGDGQAIRRMLVGLFVHGGPLPAIFDQLLGPALQRVGNEWEHGKVQVFEEHRAIELVQRALHEVRQLLPRRSRGRPTAVVATLSGDPYTVATTMAELTLSEAGWSVTNLGPDNPAETLVEAIVTLRPRLICLGINVVDDVAGFATKYALIADSARQHRTAVVIGGVAATTDVRDKIRYAACCASMRELADFATSLEPARVRE